MPNEYCAPSCLAYTAAVNCAKKLPPCGDWCVPALRVPLVHSLINHFRQNSLAFCTIFVLL